jgi:hypothetical protein
VSTELAVALISAVVSGTCASVALFGQFRLARLQAEVADRRERMLRDEEAQRFMARYRDPLSRAAFDLQSRIYNLMCLDILDRFHVHGTPRERSYVVQSTLFVFAEYLGWTEIIRREIQFLDLGDVDDGRRLTELQLQVSESLLRSDLPSPFRLFRGEQRAIGELMIVAESGPLRCLGPAAFAEQSEPEFWRWFETLDADINRMAGCRDRYTPRLIAVQHALVDLIQFLDVDGNRFPKAATAKIPTRSVDGPLVAAAVR